MFSLKKKTLIVFSGDNMNKNASLGERGDKAEMKGVGIVACDRETRGHTGRFPLSSVCESTTGERGGCVMYRT